MQLLGGPFINLFIQYLLNWAMTNKFKKYFYNASYAQGKLLRKELMVEAGAQNPWFRHQKVQQFQT